jgi:hypothetical protein
MNAIDQASSGCQLCHDGSEGGNQRSSLSPERSVSASDRIETLTATEEATFAALRIRWFGLHPDQSMSDEMILRFARAHRFHEQRAWAAMRRLDCRYVALSARGLEKQLKKRVRAATMSMQIEYRYCTHFLHINYVTKTVGLSTAFHLDERRSRVLLHAALSLPPWKVAHGGCH